jgi:hypothetical protein
MVAEQRETVQRIDADTVDIASNVSGAQRELLKYYASISSNRWLMLKVFGVLIVFVSRLTLASFCAGERADWSAPVLGVYLGIVIHACSWCALELDLVSSFCYYSVDYEHFLSLPMLPASCDTAGV